MPFIYQFWNGAFHIRFDDDYDLNFLDKCCFVDLPPGFQSKTIPEKFIYEPKLNSVPVNAWWTEFRKAIIHA